MFTTNRLHGRAVALSSALALIVCVLATAVASAEPTDPVTHQGCTYAGQSYSHGSTREQHSTGGFGQHLVTEYTCKDGEWVRGTTREVPKVKPAPVNPTPVNPTPVAPPPVPPPRAP